MYIDLPLFRVSARARSRFAGLGGVLLALGLFLALDAGGAWAFEESKHPASPVPAARWGALKPGSILGDQTGFEFHRDPRQTEPFWFGVDIENGWLFAVTGRGFQVFDATTNAAQPPMVGYGYGPNPQNQGSGGLMPVWAQSDEDWFLQEVDAPPGNDDVAAVAGWGQGFVIWDTSVKGDPRVHYQDVGVSATSVYSAILGSPAKPYTFAAASGGVYLYDLAAAQSLAKCLDDTHLNSHPCAGVYKGKTINSSTSPSGGVIHGAGNFVALARGALGFEIWNVANVGAGGSAAKVMSGSQAARGIAMWQSGASYYLAAGNFGKVYIYDVSCIAGGSCGAPAALKILDTPNGVPPISRLTVSKATGGVPYLYVSGSDTFSCPALSVPLLGPEREYLFNVSNPSNPVDVTPKAHPDGYWGWYYERCATGFNWVSPQNAKFYGNSLYRAAYSLIDVHQLGAAAPPEANFTWAPLTDVYPGTPVQFTDQSVGSPAPTEWSWTFQDGSVQFSSAQNPTVSFTSTGAKTVTLTSTNSQGPSSPVAKTVTVLDPAPQVAGVTVSPPNPVVCQPITLTATGVTGQPTLAYSWDVPGAAPAPSPTNVNPLVWNTAATSAIGPYTATVTVTNGVGTATKSANFTLGGLAALPADNAFTPTCTNCTNGAPPAGVAQLSVNVPGATEWSWDCGSGFGPYINDPVAGPVHTCSYTSIGAKTVKVKVKNCVETEKTSAGLGITINVITPLVAKFKINNTSSCFGQDCILEAGVSYVFTDESTGAEAWSFDWNGDNTFEQGPLAANDPAFTVTGAVRTIQHSFAQTATPFRPKLKVTRGSEENVFTLVQQLVVAPATPGSISVSGPSSGQPNQALSFTAGGGGSCNPAADGWSWSTSGGTGATNTASASITWTSNGNKTITATNSACSGVSGSKTVVIGSDPPPPPPPPPPGLSAAFTVSPAAPAVGQSVTFNGAGSGGSPISYAWEFGDNSPLAVGAQATHTYAQAGNYQVSLTVTGSGSCPPAPFCSASLTKTVVVGSGEPPLVPAFTTSASCVGDFGFVVCSASAGQTVSFEDQSQGNPTSWTWNFGDGGTATGKSVSHVFTQGGSVNVTLTIGKGGSSATTSKPFNVAEAATTRSIVLPWIAQTRGLLEQSSDLYVHNPGTTAMNVTLEFRKKGAPESAPPRATKTIGPGATLYVADVLKELFNKENIAGFISLTVGEGVAPVITSFNTTFQTDGKEFGQTVAGVPMVSGATAVEDKMQHLVGLINNDERLAYFGVSNPSDQPTVYKLRFFDKTGRQIGTDSQDFIISRFGQKQFQSKEVSDFGISNTDDFRVELETKSGGHLVPYASNLRLASEDPSFILAGAARAAKVYLIGVLSTPGLNNSLWQTDALLSNPSGQDVLVDITFTGNGLNGATTSPFRVTLKPGETQRLENVIDGQWGIKNGIGALTIVTASGGAFPIVQGESYDNTDPEKRFGQSMMAVSEANAAGAGQGQYLVGLRQNAENRTTFWLFNPGTGPAEYDLVYRRLDGTTLGSPLNVKLGAGKMRQFSPGQHPLPSGGVADGFTVEIKVKSGKVLGAAQVINNLTNDPAYIQGEVR